MDSWRASLEARKLSSSTINQRISAIRKLAMEAADNGLMPPTVAAAISWVKGAKQAGVRTGQWLTREQAENLIAAPNGATNKGKRDRALLAVLIGCGLRRREAAALMVDHIQVRDARWLIVDLIGKGGRVRSVPMPSWTKSAIDSWTDTAGITSGLIFRATKKGGWITGSGITPRGIVQMVQRFGAVIGDAAACSSRSASYVCETRTQGECRSRANSIEFRTRFDHHDGTLFRRETGSH